MVSNTLVVYSTVDGHTREICERLEQTLGRSGHRATLVSLDDGTDVDLSAFDRIVIGASIRYGRHRQNVVEFIDRNKALLAGRPAAFFRSAWSHENRSAIVPTPILRQAFS